MMPRATQTVFSEGIFHGLPTFPDQDGKKYTAIVTGANGISGSEIVDVLLNDGRPFMPCLGNRL